MSQLPRPKPRILDDKLLAVFGDAADTIAQVDARAQAAFPGAGAIVWEGDPATFQFSYVGDHAAHLLGHPLERWTKEATFWADVVVHADDRDGAISYCALATAQGTDHEFEYRARSVDGHILWLRDIVRVIVGPRHVPVLLRGIMFDITASKRAAGTEDDAPAAPRPTRDELLST